MKKNLTFCDKMVLFYGSCRSIHADSFRERCREHKKMNRHPDRILKTEEFL